MFFNVGKRIVKLVKCEVRTQSPFFCQKGVEPCRISGVEQVAGFGPKKCAQTQTNFFLGSGWVGPNCKIFLPNPGLFQDILGLRSWVGPG
jgi:hypothetical protein